MEDFLELAKENTDKDLETCGVLGAFLVSSNIHSPFNAGKLKFHFLEFWN